MFIPIEFPIKIQLPFIASRGWKRSIALLSMYAITTVAVIILAHGLKRYSIRKLSVHYTKDSATISTMRLDSNSIKKALNLALSVPDVNESLHGNGYGSGAILVNYLVPLKWILADLPLEEIPEGTHGHVTPMPENPFEFKLLFTKAKTHTKYFTSGADIIENTYGKGRTLYLNTDIYQYFYARKDGTEGEYRRIFGGVLQEVAGLNAPYEVLIGKDPAPQWEKV